MTSNINYAAINQNFPVAGQDNDTQVFRDNFGQIKDNFEAAKTEIEDLQDNAVRTDGPNDFLYNVVTAVTLQDAYLRTKDYGEPVPFTQEISFKQALYHIVTFDQNTSLSFIEFPTEAVTGEGLGKVGKATLELYGDGTTRTITFTTSGGTVIKKSSNFPGTLTVSSATNPVIIEVWQHSEEVIFLNYLGLFA